MSLRYSTGAVNSYSPCGVGPDLPYCIESAGKLRAWYNFAGFTVFTRWENGDVWGSDFRESSGGDLASDGGSDVPEIYFYNGHGICQNPPSSTDEDHIFVCGNFGKPDDTVIRTDCRWGNNPGNLRFAFIDASCPMDLVSIDRVWFPVFRGLHMAVGHSGDASHDTLNSPDRGGQFAALTIGFPPFSSWLFPQESIGDAWMHAGIIDIQSGCCAVALAAGNDRADAIDRRENEKINDNRPKPTPNWFAWKWTCIL